MTMHDNTLRAEGKPSRRWFQYRLSTWFVLVAIACWVMAIWPTRRIYHGRAGATVDSMRGVAVSLFLDTGKLQKLARNRGASESDEYTLYLVVMTKASKDVYMISFGPKRIQWPALALAVVCAWKGPWLRRERRRSHQ